jgi:hypothetical protein
MVVLPATMGLTVLLCSFGSVDRAREQRGYYPLYHGKGNLGSPGPELEERAHWML